MTAMPLDSTRQDFDIRPFVNQPLGAECSASTSPGR